VQRESESQSRKGVTCRLGQNWKEQILSQINLPRASQKKIGITGNQCGVSVCVRVCVCMVAPCGVRGACVCASLCILRLHVNVKIGRILNPPLYNGSIEVDLHCVDNYKRNRCPQNLFKVSLSISDLRCISGN